MHHQKVNSNYISKFIIYIPMYSMCYVSELYFWFAYVSFLNICIAKKWNRKLQIYISICSAVSFLAAIKKVRLLHLHPLLHLPRLDNREWHLHVLKYKIQIYKQIKNIFLNYNMQTNKKQNKKYKHTNKVRWYQT